jgi:hypothetical protein
LARLKISVVCPLFKPVSLFAKNVLWRMCKGPHTYLILVSSARESLHKMYELRVGRPCLVISQCLTYELNGVLE